MPETRHGGEYYLDPELYDAVYADVVADDDRVGALR